MLRFLCALSLVLLLVALESSCRKRRVAVPVAAPTPPATAPEQAPPSTATPVTTPVPPPKPAPPPAAPAKEAPKYQVNRPPQSAEPQPQQTPPPRRSSRPSNGSTTEPSSTEQPPRLGDILTPEQEHQYNTAIDQSLARAQSSLGSTANRQLTKEQQAVVAQIQSFIQQAQTTRKSNLPAARSLAERADVLARDLAGSLR